MMEYACKHIGASPEEITTVVNSNHHYRVNPYERRLQFASALNYESKDNLRTSNLLSHAKRYELSHHLAHAWSVISTCPYDKGLVLVMDGMGESYKAMVEDMSGVEEHSGDYMHDLKLLRAYGGEDFVGQPVALAPASGYREAETAYVFDRQAALLKPVFKRWSRERSPPELYNHGFENMESMGSIYSRVSSQILGDWNACGKIMGLAPWKGKNMQETKQWGGYPGGTYQGLGIGQDYHHPVPLMQGNPYDGSFGVQWDNLEASAMVEKANTWTDTAFDEMANLAASVQNDLEGCAMQLARSLQEATGQENLCVVGGVGLNSVLNGRLMRECGFKGVHVPPAPGDEGVAVGCAVYGLQRARERKAFEAEEQEKELALLTAGSDRALSKAMAMFGGSSDDLPLTQTSEEKERQRKEEEEEAEAKRQREIERSSLPTLAFPAYQGGSFTDSQIMDAIDEYSPWVDAVRTDTSEQLVEAASDLIMQGKILGWFQGRSEFGQRALGARSILGDPRHNDHRIKINEQVKQREWWRPLAPSVLDECAGDWFEGLSNDQNASPYMSLTATILDTKISDVPAVAHVDNTARLQTVRQSDSPLYHRLIAAFYAKTGIPMVLNTSFNGKGQPIVETPQEALRAFLSFRGHMDALFLGDWIITRRGFPLQGTESAAAVAPTLTVAAEMYYRSESVAPSPAAPDGGATGTRIRVDVGQAGPLLELPSQLHFDLLQLLQPAPPPEDGAGAGDNRAGDNLFPELGKYLPPGMEEQEAGNESGQVGVGELFAAMGELGGEVAWGAFRDALEWLYERSLVSFEDEDEADPQKLFDGAEILDLRT